MNDPLSLRCRPPAPICGIPDLSAFNGGARQPDPEANDPLIWLLPDIATPRSAGLALRPRVSTVPAPRFDRASAPIDLSAWRLGQDPSRWTFGRSARLLAGLAAALPLALTPSLAHARKKEPPPEPAPVGLEFGGDMLWTPILGSEIEVTLGDGVRIHGTLLTQSDVELAVILAPDGVVMRVPKELIIGLRVLNTTEEAEDDEELSELRAIREAIEALQNQRQVGDRGDDRESEQEREREPKNGRALAGVGIGLSGAGAAMLSIFAIGNAIDSSFAYYTAPMFIIGNALLGPGIPLMATGLAQEDVRRRWNEKKALEISVGPTRGGWAGNLSFRW